MVGAWPAALPQCFNMGFSSGLGDGLAEVTPDVGPPIARRRALAVTRPLAGVMRMTLAQKAALQTFYEVTLDMGALPFNFPDQEGGTVLVRFAKGSQPTWLQTARGVYRVNITLVVMP